MWPKRCFLTGFFLGAQPRGKKKQGQTESSHSSVAGHLFDQTREVPGGDLCKGDLSFEWRGGESGGEKKSGDPLFSLLSFSLAKGTRKKEQRPPSSEHLIFDGGHPSDLKVTVRGGDAGGHQSSRNELQSGDRQDGG